MSTLIEEFFLSFGLISIVALLGSFLSAKWKQPTVMGLIFVGMLVGPNVLGVIQNSELILLLAELGAVLLLFSIGLKFSIEKVIHSGFRSLVAASMIMLSLFIVGWQIAHLLGFTTFTSLAMATAFSFSSTAIFVRLSQSFGLMKSDHVPLVISILVFEDIIAVAAMTFFASLKSESQNASPFMDILFSIIFSLVLMGFVYVVLLSFLKKIISYFKQSMTKEYILQFSMGMTVLFCFLAITIGLSPAVGAFLAGSLIAQLPIRKQVNDTVSSFVLAFSSYFFVSIGLLVNPAVIIEFIPHILIFAFSFWIVAFISVLFASFVVGLKPQSAILAGLSMAIMGEFSLLVAKEIAPMVKEYDIISILAGIVFLTTILSAITLSKRDFILKLFFSIKLPAVYKNMYCIRIYVCSVIKEFEKTSHLKNEFKTHFPKLAKNTAIFAIVGALIFFIRGFAGKTSIATLIPGHDVNSDILLLLFIFLLPILFSIFKELKIITDAFSNAFLHSSKIRKKSAGRMIVRRIIFASIFYQASVYFPVISKVFTLPSFVNILSLIFFAITLLLFYDAFSLIWRFFPKKDLIKFN